MVKIVFRDGVEVVLEKLRWFLDFVRDFLRRRGVPSLCVVIRLMGSLRSGLIVENVVWVESSLIVDVDLRD